jgi:hypothetical protein
VVLLSDGMFRSDDTVLKADGKDYSVPATGYWDTVSVRVVDDHTVEVTSKKAGKPMFTETDTVSVEGNLAMQLTPGSRMRPPMRRKIEVKLGDFVKNVEFDGRRLDVRF